MVKFIKLNFFKVTAVVFILSAIVSCVHTNSRNYRYAEVDSYDLADEFQDIVTADETQILNTEEYHYIKENEFKDAFTNPQSTFSIDVDHSSYANVRRFLSNSILPPKGAVRIEEMINYFNYNYPGPETDHPFNIYTEIAECPWNKENQLVHLGIQGKRINYEITKPSNLVFLIDVSGSMSDALKLPFVKKSLKILVSNLQDRDKVAIVQLSSHQL